MIESIKNFLIKPVRYEKISAQKRDEERQKMKALQRNSSKGIYIVAGELDKDFYNKEFADIISKKFETDKKFVVSIIFSKNDNSPYKERIEKLKSENSHLCELLKNGAFDGRLKMYLSKRRPEHHFGIVDDTILIEKEHKPGDPRDVLFVQNYKSLIDRYSNHFKEMCNKKGVLRLTEKDLFNSVAC